MILIGRYLSPFVRRTATVLTLTNTEFARKELAAATDGEALAEFNPLRRVPALVLDDGEVLIDSAAIIDYVLDNHDSSHQLCPASGEARWRILRTSAIATGAMEKTVAAAYERSQRPKEKVHEPYREKLLDQVAAALSELEAQAEHVQYFGGDTPNLADVNTVVAYDFARIVAPEIAQQAAPQHLPALAARANALDAFASTRWRQE